MLERGFSLVKITLAKNLVVVLVVMGDLWTACF